MKSGNETSIKTEIKPDSLEGKISFPVLYNASIDKEKKKNGINLENRIALELAPKIEEMRGNKGALKASTGLLELREYMPSRMFSESPR